MRPVMCGLCSRMAGKPVVMVCIHRGSHGHTYACPSCGTTDLVKFDDSGNPHSVLVDRAKEWPDDIGDYR